ncbi:hypothetical protein WJX84_010564 [Apatococcus fuscideae]|uniref:F-box domain-containing protein n=1 Tax=Apatococcus fuscideae TaxID=2026836 RepID=A0AAW1T1H1_9CHLO
MLRKPKPARVRRSTRLLGHGLGLTSVKVTKQTDLRQPKAAIRKSSKGSSAWKDQTNKLPEALVEEVLKQLSPSDTISCALVSKRWRRASASSIVWKPRCKELWNGKQYQPSCDSLNFKEMYVASLADAKRTDLQLKELCSLTWTFRFKHQAGHYWTSFDPYWTKAGPMMQRKFHPDGSLTGDPAHHPFWNAAWESRWRFTKSSLGKRGFFVKVNHWPALSISRTPDWGWKMENCWVVVDWPVQLVWDGPGSARTTCGGADFPATLEDINKLREVIQGQSLAGDVRRCGTLSIGRHWPCLDHASPHPFILAATASLATLGI